MSKLSNGGTDQKPKGATKKWLFRMPSFDANTIIAGCTVMIVVLALLQYQLSRRTMIESLAHTRESLELTRQSLEVAQRAWVAVRSVESAALAPGKLARFEFRYQNTGNTPAFAFRTVVGSRLVEAGSLERPELPPTPTSSLGVLLPGAFKYTTHQVRAYSPDEVDTIRRGQKVLYFTARLEYKDVFGKQHFTTYCARYRVDGKLVLCDEGNEMS